VKKKKKAKQQQKPRDKSAGTADPSTNKVMVYSETSEKRTVWEEYKVKPFCPLLRGGPL